MLEYWPYIMALERKTVLAHVTMIACGGSCQTDLGSRGVVCLGQTRSGGVSVSRPWVMGVYYNTNIAIQLIIYHVDVW